MSVAAIIAGITTAGQLADSIGSMTNQIPTPPKDLEDKHRWLTVTIFNQTQYGLLFEGPPYFDSGRFWTAPTNVEPFNEMTFSGCDKDNSFLTGVSGGVTFKLQMPKEGGGYEELDIGVGFTNPQAGSLKSSVIITDSAKAAYEAASGDGTSCTSQNFPGKDTNGNPTTINFYMVSTSGTEASVTITEQIVSGGN